MANPTTYFGWVMPTSSSLVTNLPADFNTFGQGVDTSMQDLLGGTTGQVLSKTSGTNMDFTWVTPTDQSPLTTKGDLFTFSTVDARLGVGTNGQTLVADSTASTGLKWATPTSGGMTLLSTTTLSGATTTISSISQSYKNLVVQIYGVSNATANGIFRTSINSAFPVNSFAYRSQYATVTSYATVTDYLQISANVDLLRTNTDNAFTITISDYANTSAGTKTFTCNTGFLNSSSQLTQAFTMGQIVLSAGISSFTFSNVGGNLSTGTVLIYGVS